MVNGYTDSTFRPDSQVTRAEFAKMLVLAMSWDLVTPQTPTFNDVGPANWAYTYIETAYAHGIVGGYDDRTFRPQAPVTRGQIAKMVTLAHSWSMNLPGTSSFNDVSPYDWFFSYAEMLRSAGAMRGYADGTFRPNAAATRAQVAQIITISLFSDPNQ